MSESVHDRDEDRFAALLRAADADAAPSDAAALARIEQLSAAAFRDAVPCVLPAPPLSRNSPMVLFPLRLVVACSVFAAGLVAWFSAGVTDANRVALADVLKEISTADTLHLQVVRADRAADVYVRQPGRVRWEQSSTQYEIMDGSSFWRVDNGRVAESAPAAPRWLNDAGGVDLLGLLNLPATGPVRDQVLQPAGEHDYAGRRCRVYSRTLPQQALRLDVYTDLKTGRFVAMAAREPAAAVDAPPVTEVRLVALNPKLDEQQFAVSATLADRGVGKVTDVQGLVTLRPRVSDRWTLISRETPLEPGDWVRTTLRGAHAAKLTLSSGQQIIVGLGALLEVVDANQIRLTSGEVQIERTPTATGEFVLLGPGSERVAIADTGKKLFRVTTDDKLQPFPQTPLWLAGFEGTTANESLGSLIVNIDGRNEPLTVGEHRVTVDIRDQIARTTIEETFVNRTAARLEGQFHFPLPPDASISGFGMWIGNELVEADIVEKQRAREIYETILREKRDPGLLEWTGGNLFKARVFPIEPFSEKRIKITYTQVLPLRANRYRYSYGLRSELLQKFPLRELSLQVNVHSALPLKSVTSPTHTCRTQATPHSAR
ncbi:MAG: VIT domain-containing protein, partial [Planctomycetaceae bacterium]|nr:VIT domain-containing protein [Planctomycetaceae bacterium]